MSCFEDENNQMTAGASDTEFIHQSLRTRLIFRAGAVADLAAELERLGVRRPLVLASPRTAVSALFAQVRRLTEGFDALPVTDIPAHSSVDVATAIAGQARAVGIDGVVAVGGGSVSDTAKAVALLLAEGEPLARHASRFVPPRRIIAPNLLAPKLPILSIPTTASGAEVTPSFGIRTTAGTKLLFWDAQLASRVVLADPAANLEWPAMLMLTTGMNGLAHCIEGLYSIARSPVTDALALDAMRRFGDALPAVARQPDDVDARARLMLAAHLSGMVLASARSCLHHAICHVLGATFGVPHGAANAVILPHAVRFNAPAAREALRAAAAAVGHDDLPAWLQALQAATGVPSRLRDLGIERDALPAVAAHVMHERGLAFNPRQIEDASEIEAILMGAW